MSPPKNTNRSLLWNVAVSSLGTYFEYAVGLAAGVLVARSLGPAAFAEYGFATAVAGWLVTASNHALTTSSIKFVAEARGENQPQLAWAIAARYRAWQRYSMLLVISAFLITSVVAFYVGRPILPIAFAVLVAFASVARSAYALNVAIAKGFEKLDVEAISTAIAGVVTVILVLGCYYRGGNSLEYLAVYTTSSVVLLFSASVLMRRRGVYIRAAAISVELSSRIKRHTWWTAALTLLGLASNKTIEIWLLNTYASRTDLAYFLVSATLTRGAVDVLASGLSAAVMPTMARRYKSDPDLVSKALFPNVLRYYWAIGLVIAGLGAFMAPAVLTILYGKAYEGATNAVAVSLSASGLSLFAAGIGAFQSISDHQRDRVLATFVSFIASLVVAVTLVPSFGLNGALISILVSRVAFCSLVIWQVEQVADVKMPWIGMRNIALAGLLATGVAFASRATLPSNLSTTLGMFLFLATFLTASATLRCWTPHEYLRLYRIVSSAGIASSLLKPIVTWLAKLGGIQLKPDLPSDNF